MTILFLAKATFFIPFLFIELFENLFIEIMPTNLKRKYYTRLWGKRKIQDVFWIMYFDSFLSSAVRRAYAMTDKERSVYLGNLKDDE